MPSTRIKPWIEADDFETFRQAAVDNLDLPNTYDEWLELAADEHAKFAAAGIVYQKVIVHPSEFAAYCLACGQEQNAVMLGAFATVKKAREQK